MNLSVKKQEKYSFFLLLLFSILVLSIIPLYRILYYDALPPGETVYSHLALGRTLMKEGIVSVDPGVALARPYHFDFFDLLFGIFGSFVGMTFTGLLLPFVLGLLTLFFCYRMFLLVLSPKQALLTGIFLVTCPVFLTIFSEATNITLLLSIFCTGFFFFFQKNWTKYLSFVFFGLLLFSGPIHIFLALLLILSFGPSAQDKRYVLILFSFLLFLFIWSFSFQTAHFSLHHTPLLLVIQNFFSDLGGTFGFSVFTVVLAVLSIPHLWKKKIISSFLWIFFLVILLLIFFISELYAFYLLPFLAIGALFGFEQLLSRQWKLEYLSRITLFLFVLGILFSATSTVSRIATADPTSEIFSAFSWLEQHSSEDAIVFASPSAGSWIEYGAKRRVLIDRKTSSLDATLLVDSQKLLTSRNIEDAFSLFQKYHIDYVAVVHGFSDDSWSQDNTNLLFLLQNSPHFKPVFSNDRVEIWSINTQATTSS